METQTAPERIKVLDRPHLARKRQQEAAELARTVNNLAALYADLHLGEFNSAILSDVYATGGAEARRLYIEAAKEDAEKVRSHGIRAQIMQEAEQWSTPFAEAARKAKQSADSNGSEARYLLEYLTRAADGRYFLADEDAARLADSAAVYLTDPEQIEKYRQHAAAVDAINAFIENGKAAPPVWYSLFEMGEDGRIKMPSQGTNYAYLLELGRKHALTPTAPNGSQQETAEATQPHETECKQQNRPKPTAPRMVKGITKAQERRDRGAELRAGLHKASPD